MFCAGLCCCSCLYVCKVGLLLCVELLYLGFVVLSGKFVTALLCVKWFACILVMLVLVVVCFFRLRCGGYGLRGSIYGVT